MRPPNPIAVVGAAIHAPRDPRRRSLEEAIYAVVQGALSDAGLASDDIDSIVVAANDQLDGRAISVMMASGPVGGVGREILSTPSAAEHAFVLGALQIAAGRARTELVVAWHPVEVTSVRDALKLGTDPYFHRALPLDERAASGLQASAVEHATKDARSAAIGVVAKNRAHGALAYPDRSPAPLENAWIGAGKPVSWPLTENMLAPPAFGLVALLLADRSLVAERKLSHCAWIEGMGWSTEASFLGDRDLNALPSLAASAARAYRAAGIDDPATAFDLAEVSDGSPYQELLAYEGLGLCTRSDWSRAGSSGRFARGGPLPVNLSGGAQSFNPVFCAGLVSIVEAANQVRGRAGPHQLPRAQRALAHAASGFAMQYNTVVVLSRDAAGDRA